MRYGLAESRTSARTWCIETEWSGSCYLIPFSEAFAGLLIASHFVHSGRLEEAGQALEMGLEKSPKEVRARLCLEAAWFAARIRGDLVSAHQWLDARRRRSQSGPP